MKLETVIKQDETEHNHSMPVTPDKVVKDALNCEHPLPLWEIVPTTTIYPTEETDIITHLSTPITNNSGWAIEKRNQPKVWINPQNKLGNFANRSYIYNGYHNVWGEVLVKTRKGDLTARNDLLEQEAKLMSRLYRITNEFIPKIYDIMSDGKKLYIVMEKVQGQNIEQYMQAHEAAGIEPEFIEFFLKEVISKTLLLHKANVYHNDIQAKNLVYDETNNVIRLVDFELSTFARQNNPDEAYEAKYGRRDDLKGIIRVVNRLTEQLKHIREYTKFKDFCNDAFEAIETKDAENKLITLIHKTFDIL